MSETSSGGEALSHEQQAALRGHMQTMMDPGSIVATGAEEIQAAKAEALHGLANGLADPEFGHAIAELIIEEHEATERPETITDVYAYWLIIKTALREHPDAELPGTFLNFTQELAQNHGETDITFELIVINSRVDDVKSEAGISVIDVGPSEQATSLTKELGDVLELEKAVFTETNTTAHEALAEMSSDD